MSRKPTRTLFGTDGVRGVANEPPMTPELALALGRAVTHVAGRGKRHAPRVIIGKDTRLSGYMLETAIASGICSMGGRVLLCGPIPTPAVAHLTVSMRADAGIVISASHNPYRRQRHQGLRRRRVQASRRGRGRDRSPDRGRRGASGPGKTGPGIGRAQKLEDARGRYVAFAKATFPRDLSLDGVRVVIDAAHGAAYGWPPSFSRSSGRSVHAIGVKPNGVNINRDSGALHPDNARAEVVRRGAQIGIALDGDADRVIVIDEKGQIVDGDAVMAMCALRMIRDKELEARHGRGHGHEQPRSRARADQARGRGWCARPWATATWSRPCARAASTSAASSRGTSIFLDHASTGDGIIGALQVLALMMRTGKPLSELAREAMERVPQVLENVVLASRRPLEEMKYLARGHGP